MYSASFEEKLCYLFQWQKLQFESLHDTMMDDTNISHIYQGQHFPTGLLSLSPSNPKNETYLLPQQQTTRLFLKTHAFFSSSLQVSGSISKSCKECIPKVGMQIVSLHLDILLFQSQSQTTWLNTGNSFHLFLSLL